MMIPSNNMKKCPTCGFVLSSLSFYKDKTKKDGCSTYCIPCTRIHNKERYEKDTKRIKSQNRIYYKKNREKAILNMKKRRERMLAENPNFHKEHGQKYRDYYLSKSTLYYRKNREKMRAKEKEKRIKMKTAALKKLGSLKCIKCGFNNFHALCIDHINNDGFKERRKTGVDSINVYKKILSLPLDEARRLYQVLCRNCNWLKYVEWTTGGL